MEEIPMIDVRVLGRKDLAVLIQWNDNGSLRRAYVPADEVFEDEEGGHFVPADQLELSIAYGVRWADLVEFKASPEALEQALYKAGIWTVDDLRVGTQAAVAALQAVYGVDLGVLLQAGAKFDENMEVEKL